MKLISNNEEETQKVAMNFAKQLKGGEVILMHGDLGAGKTVFVKGLAKALGVVETVKSPTFNLMKVYELPKSYLCHIDAYRLKNFDDLLDIGADEYLGKENVISVIEWAERIMEAKKQKSKKAKITGKIITVLIRHGKNDNERMIEIN